MERSLIRPFEPSDLPEVAIMFLKAFRGRTAAAPTSLIEHMRDVYFGHPAYDRRMGSLVHLRLDGAIDGFIGAFPQPLMLSGRALRGVVTGGFMVDDPAANPITGARLVRRLLNGPQDVTITDTANRRSLDFQRVLGCETLDLQSLQWTKILEPASYVLSLLDVRTGRLPMMPLRPLARLLDRVRVEKAQYHPEAAGATRTSMWRASLPSSSASPANSICARPGREASFFGFWIRRAARRNSVPCSSEASNAAQVRPSAPISISAGAAPRP
jgi:hypothetical protein